MIWGEREHNEESRSRGSGEPRVVRLKSLIVRLMFQSGWRQRSWRSCESGRRRAAAAAAGTE